MMAAAEAMEFERAASIRDRITAMRDQIGKPVSAVPEKEAGGKKRRGARSKSGDPAQWKGRVPAAETECLTPSSVGFSVAGCKSAPCFYGAD